MSYLKKLENDLFKSIITKSEWELLNSNYMELSKDEKLKLDNKVIDEKEINKPNVFEEKLLSEVGVIKSILQFFLILSIISILYSLLMFSQF
jgi:hypothetical protein